MYKKLHSILPRCKFTLRHATYITIIRFVSCMIIVDKSYFVLPKSKFYITLHYITLFISKTIELVKIINAFVSLAFVLWTPRKKRIKPLLLNLNLTCLDTYLSLKITYIIPCSRSLIPNKNFVSYNT